MTLKKNKTLRNNKKRDITVSELEMNKCNHFCNNAYLKKYSAAFRKRLKTNTYFQSKSDREIEDLLKNVNMDQQVNDCKKIFCSPNCKEYHKNKKTRYVCPACLKNFPELKKLGAITYCKHTFLI